MDGIMELSKSLQQMDIDASAYACLSALTLVNGNISYVFVNRFDTVLFSPQELKIYKFHPCFPETVAKLDFITARKA